MKGDIRIDFGGGKFGRRVEINVKGELVLVPKALHFEGT
jgi:hypothetical protein